MFSLNKYYDDIYLLSNSLVVKINDISVSINNTLERKLGYIEDKEDKTKWKYYRNLFLT